MGCRERVDRLVNSLDVDLSADPPTHEQLARIQDRIEALVESLSHAGEDGVRNNKRLQYACLAGFALSVALYFAGLIGQMAVSLWVLVTLSGYGMSLIHEVDAKADGENYREMAEALQPVRDFYAYAPIEDMPPGVADLFRRVRHLSAEGNAPEDEAIRYAQAVFREGRDLTSGEVIEVMATLRSLLEEESE